ncbi:MAG: Archaeal/vacuolar-type H+-ATPase subunit E [Erysipelotrichaceae bacterium]|nr:MAG: Archaeal/vacuolar-type H+-ATPase subunit [Erysipelotrichaceae bacterium]TXT19994.1 MAG: Archaeal/vacuolar-type H+-ATPase subunit E [Erysipelotrichaceae bacterium]
MAGLEKILQKIEADATESCEQILSIAKSESDQILTTARFEGEKAKHNIIDESSLEDQNAFRMATSQAENLRKKAILGTKISIVNETIERSLQKLQNLPDEAYFSLIKNLVIRYCLPGVGVVCFSKKDLERLPKGFETELNQLLKEEGKSVSISKQPLSIDYGFVISYQDIEQNCTLNSLLDNNLDMIKDKLYELLFVEKGI